MGVHVHGPICVGGATVIVIMNCVWAELRLT